MNTELLLRARAEIGDLTPLTTDCGALCDAACCQADEDGQGGVYLFPGEEALAAGMDWGCVEDTDFAPMLVCNGMCDREKRPFACRIFPLFPYVGEDGRIRAVYDPRSWRLCPLTRNCARVPLRRDFVRAVRRAGRILMKDPACAAFLRAQSREIDDLGRLLPLGDERPPIARRKLR